MKGAKGGTRKALAFQCVSLYVLCSFLCSLVRGRLFCDCAIFRRCYMRYYMSVFPLLSRCECYHRSGSSQISAGTPMAQPNSHDVRYVLSHTPIDATKGHGQVE